MIPFHSRCPEVAARETRAIHVLGAGVGLPVGEYGFIELYCEDPACDCRRVLVQVFSKRAPQTPLATINYGWESPEFYTRWMHGNARAGHEIASACLDPLHRQSKYAGELLDLFRERMMADPEYVARLARHYEMFKATQWNQSNSASAGPLESLHQTTASPKTIQEILSQLQRLPDEAEFAPYGAALLAAANHRESIVPELIAAIDRVAADPDRYLQTDNEDSLHLFALYLLGQFCETRALDAFLRFFSLPGDRSLDLTGDTVTTRGAAMLVSVCGGDPAPLLKLIHDEAVNEFVRGAAIDGLAVQSLWGERSRSEVVEELRRLFSTLPKPGDGYIWAALIGLVCDFHAPELAAEARRAFAEGLVDETVIDLKFFESDLSQHGEKNFERFRMSNDPIDAVNDCSSWLCFRGEDDDFDPLDDADNSEDAEMPGMPDAAAPAPVYNSGDFKKPTPYIAPPKIGRNDPCPCGSGKKFKKCCGK